MAKSVMRISINQLALRTYLRAPDQPVYRMLRTLNRRVVNDAKRRAPVQEGTLRSSIESEIVQGPNGLLGRVGSSLFYAIYVHEGTGIYVGRPLIRPKSGKVLRFKPRGGPIVFAAYVRGQKPQPFLVDALRAVVAAI